MNSIAVILGGGKGTRLYPLTKYRSKPAVPLAGKYRLIDIPISNCLNSNISRIFVLTQFNSASLNRHVNLSYHFDAFRREGFVNILAAEQTMKSTEWFKGTADAVRKTLIHYKKFRFKYFIILSGDHIYKMDYQDMIRNHELHNADISVAALPVKRNKIKGLGVLKINNDGIVERFVEKPKDEKLIDSLEVGDEFWNNSGVERKKDTFLANMGVYIFNRKILEDILNNGKELDFGSEIFPKAIENKRKIFAHLFDGYWEDIGTIRSFYDANLGFIDRLPKFDFYDEDHRYYSHSRFLPPSKIHFASTEKAILCEGCIVDDAAIKSSIVGVRSIVSDGAKLVSTIMMGADYYETRDDFVEDRREDIPRVGIGEYSFIEGAIIDKNARIGKNVYIRSGNVHDTEGPGWMLKDGVIVIEKNAVIPDGTVLDFSSEHNPIHISSGQS